VHFSVIIYDFAFEVDGDLRIPRVGSGSETVLLHDAECSPDFLLTADGFEGADFGPSRVHLMAGSIDIERPWMLYSGKRMRSV
jgi:hypothetical protein